MLIVKAKDCWHGAQFATITKLDRHPPYLIVHMWNWEPKILGTPRSLPGLGKSANSFCTHNFLLYKAICLTHKLWITSYELLCLVYFLFFKPTDSLSLNVLMLSATAEGVCGNIVLQTSAHGRWAPTLDLFKGFYYSQIILGPAPTHTPHNMHACIRARHNPEQVNKELSFSGPPVCTLPQFHLM